MGTPFYLAPEIWEEHPYTEKSDVWSLGVILYELTTLQKPFVAENMEMLKEKVLRGKIAKPESPIPKEIQEVILKILKKNP